MNEIISNKCTDLNRMESESVWCKLKVDSTTSLTVGVYYKNQAVLEQELQVLFRSSEITSKGQASIIGDFNYPKIYWDTLECDSIGTKFSGLLLDIY